MTTIRLQSSDKMDFRVQSKNGFDRKVAKGDQIWPIFYLLLKGSKNDKKAKEIK